MQFERFGCKLLLKAIIFTQLVSCDPHGWRAVGPRQNYPSDPGQNYPGGPGQSIKQPPYPAFVGNQSLQPSPVDTSNCKVCTLSVSVSPSNLAVFLRIHNMNCSQSPSTTGPKSPQIRPVSPQFHRNRSLHIRLI